MNMRWSPAHSVLCILALSLGMWGSAWLMIAVFLAV